MSTETTPPTDTPKYIGSIANADAFYLEGGAFIEHGSDSFTEVERTLMEKFAYRRDMRQAAGREPYEAISEIYVRAREVQKLVRAVDAVVAARNSLTQTHPNEWDDALLALGKAINTLDEARAAIGDIK